MSLIIVSTLVACNSAIEVADSSTVYKSLPGTNLVGNMEILKIILPRYILIVRGIQNVHVHVSEDCS